VCAAHETSHIDGAIELACIPGEALSTLTLGLASFIVQHTRAPVPTTWLLVIIGETRKLAAATDEAIVAVALCRPCSYGEVVNIFLQGTFSVSLAYGSAVVVWAVELAGGTLVSEPTIALWGIVNQLASIATGCTAGQASVLVDCTWHLTEGPDNPGVTLTVGLVVVLVGSTLALATATFALQVADRSHKVLDTFAGTGTIR
jgi:hypothetical protein